MAGPWEKYQAAPDGPWAKYAPAEPSMVDQIVTNAKNLPGDIAQFGRDLGAGALRGFGSIGATLIRPFESGQDNAQRRDAMDAALQQLGANPDSAAYGVAKVAGEIAGTAGVGSGIANTLRLVPGVAQSAGPLLSALETGGMSAGGAKGLAGLGARVVGGAATGGATAGLVNPEYAGTGAAVGAIMPPAAMAAGKAAKAVGSALRSSVTPEVAQLAGRAKELGIDIPADRLADSRPMNAVAAGLNYVPFSGRAATEERMVSQLNKAVSKTFGQDSSNVTLALRKAGDVLGGKFDDALKNTGVAFDAQLLDDIARVHNKAADELGDSSLKAISSKVRDLMEKGADGTISGQAAYNIKRELDRIGRSADPHAFHALELKGVLMDALNRSLGPEKAAAFAETRRQYGNMLALEKLAKNGVDGEISAARLANMKNINNQQLQELADIAAQFVKGREGAHGAAQRAAAGIAGAYVAGPAALGASVAAGRAANAALNSNTLRNVMLGNTNPAIENSIAKLLPITTKVAPVVSAQ